MCAQNHSDHLTFKLFCINFIIFADFWPLSWMFHHALHIKRDAHITTLLNDNNTECSSSHIQHSLLMSGYIYAGFLFATLLCILCAVYKKKMHVGSRIPTSPNVLTLKLLHGFCKNLEQTHNSQNSYFFKFILPTTPLWQTHKSEKLEWPYHN